MAKAPKTAKARVLLDGAYGRCNDVVELDSAAIAEGVAASELDDKAEAVAYAESLKNTQ